jgi:hypothetical protein
MARRAVAPPPTGTRPRDTTRTNVARAFYSTSGQVLSSCVVRRPLLVVEPRAPARPTPVARKPARLGCVARRADVLEHSWPPAFRGSPRWAPPPSTAALVAEQDVDRQHSLHRCIHFDHRRPRGRSRPGVQLRGDGPDIRLVLELGRAHATARWAISQPARKRMPPDQVGSASARCRHRGCPPCARSQTTGSSSWVPRRMPP